MELLSHLPCNSVCMRIWCTLSAFSADFIWENPAAESTEKSGVYIRVDLGCNPEISPDWENPLWFSNILKPGWGRPSPARILWKCRCERATQKSQICPSRGPGRSLRPPQNQSNQSLVQRQSAGFPPAKAANCVWRDTRWRRLNPQPLRRKASAFSPAKEDFWTHVLQPFHCGVSSRLTKRTATT